jgi:hypothetical protein
MQLGSFGLVCQRGKAFSNWSINGGQNGKQYLELVVIST